MELINDNDKNIPILHFQGTAKLFYSNLMNLIKCDNNLPNDLSIVTTFNNYEIAILVQQLDSLNIPYINKVPLGSGWVNTLKPHYIIKALKDVNTKYVLILDANDILLNGSLETVINDFLKYNIKLLFNATKNNYPPITIDKIRDRDWRGDFKYFNAGACIGETNYALQFYEKCYNLMKSGSIPNPLNSEQLIVRHIFSEYTDEIDFDWKRNIFTTFGNTELIKINEDKYRIV